MPVAVSKASELLKHLNDNSLRLSEIEVQGYVRELKRLLEQNPSREVVKATYAALRLAYFRLHDPDRELFYARKFYGVDPSDTTAVMPLTASLVNNGEFEQARHLLLDKRHGLPDSQTGVAAAMLAVLEGHLGLIEEATGHLKEGLAQLDFTSPDSVLMLANACAELGYADQSIELCARYFALVTGIKLGDTAAHEFIAHVEAERPEAFWVMRNHSLRTAIVAKVREAQMAQTATEVLRAAEPHLEHDAELVDAEFEPLRIEAETFEMGNSSK